MDYESFLASKLIRAVPAGLAEPRAISERLFPFQRDIVRWGLRRGRCAFFADTGLGKGFMALEWLRHVVEHTGKPGLILTPLAVAAQFVREGQKFGVDVKLAREQADATGPISVTNYDRLHKFDPSAFGAVVLDESSCLKDYTSATRTALIEAFATTPFRLCCTATPAPNDFTEIGNHAEFLGVMKRTEMLSMFFVHDGGSTQDWRLKGHAEQDFWKWVCSWGLLVKSPADLGYDDGPFALPPLEVRETIIAGDPKTAWAAGQLFVTEATTLNEQRAARRASLDDRVRVAAEIVAREPEESWVVWGELNDECDDVTQAIPGAVQVAGSDDADVKEARLLDFSEGRTRVLVSKSSIAGFGLNWQHCARMMFLGSTHSFERYYQAVRRCWRFGQERQVQVHIVTSEAEGAVSANLKRKQVEAARMAEEMRGHTAAIVREAVGATTRDGTPYEPTVAMRVPAWLA